MYDDRSLLALTSPYSLFFFFNDTATTEIYTLSLHDALPIFRDALLVAVVELHSPAARRRDAGRCPRTPRRPGPRSEEHTSELQSRQYIVCRLLLEKKKNYELTVKTAAIGMARFEEYSTSFVS